MALLNAPRRAQLAALLCGLSVIQAVSTTHADEPSITRLGDEIEVYAERARQDRVAANITTLAAAASLVPAGIVLWGRSDSLAHTLGVNMTFAGGIPVVFMIGTLFPSRMERLRDDLALARASGASDAELQASIETKWAGAARSARKQRKIAGWVDLLLGTAATGTGLFFLLSDPVAGLGRDNQYALGYAIAASGVPLTVFGVRSLVQDSLEEVSWDAHRAASGLAAPAARPAPAPSAGLVPLRGGVEAVAGFAF